MRRLFTAALCLALIGAAGIALAQQGRSIGEPGRTNKLSAKPNPLKNVYFGEQHIHTRNSPDAFAMGTRGTWDDVYRYAMGEEITLSTTGQKIKKSTPHDFVGLTDHSEYFVVMPRLIDPKDSLSKSDFAKKLAAPDASSTGPDSAISIILGSILASTPMPEYVKPEILVGDWARYVKTANRYNKPGRVSTTTARRELSGRYQGSRGRNLRTHALRDQ